MKTVLIISILTTVLINANSLLEVLSVEDIDSQELENRRMIEVESQAIQKAKYQEVQIKDNGVNQTILVEVKKNLEGNSSLSVETEVNSELSSKDGLIVDFYINPNSLDEFESTFNIKIKEKLKIGYYIFENNSQLSDILLIESILKSDNQNLIKTIRPNWKMGVKAF